jgi:fructokinase
MSEVMRKVVAIGETVLDIVFRDSQPIVAKAGGSMLNTAVSLGRLKLPVHFISEYGADTVGTIIDKFLAGNGVDTSFIYHYTEGKSALALAFLDDKNNASYDFYKIYPEKRLDIDFPTINKDDLVLFGSFFALTGEIRNSLMTFINDAKANGALIIYDPNFRKSHAKELDTLRPLIFENMSKASVVRCSDEDMEFIFQVHDPDSAYEKIKPLCSNLLYTSSSKAVYLRTPEVSLTFPVRKITPLSTIGAGDNFNAGIIYGLFNHLVGNSELTSLSEDKWRLLLEYGVDFASEVCLSYDNYVSEDFALKLIGKQ